MAITKIEVPELFDFGSDNSAFKLPTGTTAERPTSPSNGEMRFNTTTGYVEYYDTTDAQWWEIDYAPDPFVPSDNFNTVLYQGNGSTQAVTGTAFTPDLVWVKGRGVATSNNLFDSIRGNQRIISNSTGAQVDLNPYAPDGLPSFNSNGFNIGDNFNGDYGLNGDPSGTYGSAAGYVAWCWKAGGAPTATNSGGQTPTSGSKMVDGVASTANFATSTSYPLRQSVNSSAGFSITTITKSASDIPLEVPHGLNSPPELIMLKTTSTSDDWNQWQTAIGTGAYLSTNRNGGNDGATASSGYGFTVVNNDIIRNQWTGAIRTWVCYAWHSVEGYSKMGSYNGSNSPISIITGFRPAFLMVKRTNATSNWLIIDSARGAGSNAKALYPNSSAAESDSWNTSFDSNGFTISSNEAWLSVSGGEYIFMAFAADPT